MGVFAKGMDPAVIDASGDKFNQFKTELIDIANAVTSTVQTIHSNWEGTDASQFVSDWNGKKAQVTAAADTLGQLGQKLKSNAQQQQSTSAG
ncbi:WXG100 family type VII secretion target [Lapillicoccus jejuensis]|uniref:WXG100 family type VII secretion target n=1 Tax=Lapillicoccus jejuensis TaxID=402171 RepID=A0A542DZ60_9MICO|nr:WXG100 family type VII secretion target [Lapillicoccus jejuensis]TQJ08381.1 WXG100 family type VII secretion target [Lapillicoccus jejuensis]